MAPHAQIEARNIAVLDTDLYNIAEYRQRTFSYGLDFGREFGNWGDIRTGYTVDRGKSHVRIGNPGLDPIEFDSRGYFVRLSYDRLDDVNFPRHGQSATLEWDAVNFPTLSGYRVYYGTASGAYLQASGTGINVGNVTTFTVTGLGNGARYFFAVTAYDSSNNESGYSNEVFKDIP